MAYFFPFFVQTESNSQKYISKGGSKDTHTHTHTHLVSAMLVAITIFLTPGGGLLNTWEERGRQMRSDFSDTDKKWIQEEDEQTPRLTHSQRDRRGGGRRMLTCVWFTVGMRECRGMITNRSETQQDTKERVLLANGANIDTCGRVRLKITTNNLVNIENKCYQHYLWCGNKYASFSHVYDVIHQSNLSRQSTSDWI